MSGINLLLSFNSWESVIVITVVLFFQQKLPCNRSRVIFNRIFLKKKIRKICIILQKIEVCFSWHHHSMKFYWILHECLQMSNRCYYFQSLVKLILNLNEINKIYSLWKQFNVFNPKSYYLSISQTSKQTLNIWIEPWLCRCAVSQQRRLGALWHRNNELSSSLPRART